MEILISASSELDSKILRKLVVGSRFVMQSVGIKPGGKSKTKSKTLHEITEVVLNRSGTPVRIVTKSGSLSGPAATSAVKLSGETRMPVTLLVKLLNNPIPDANSRRDSSCIRFTSAKTGSKQEVNAKAIKDLEKQIKTLTAQLAKLKAKK